MTGISQKNMKTSFPMGPANADGSIDGGPGPPGSMTKVMLEDKSFYSVEDLTRILHALDRGPANYKTP